MLKLENVPPEEMPEVVHLASVLYERDKEKSAEDQERQATVDAAREVGLPEEYLHRAAAELHNRRVEQVQKAHGRNRSLLAIGAAVLVMGGATAIMMTSIRPPSAPPVAPVAQIVTSAVPPFSATTWKLQSNPGTQATVNFQNGSATLHVSRFAPDAANHFTANLNTSTGAQDLSAFRTMSIRLRGTLPQVRVYLEHGSERWRSPAIAVQRDDKLVRLDLSQFEMQTREGADGAWHKVGYQPPGIVDDVSIKTGWFVNDPGASGYVTLGDMRFE